MHAWSKPAYSYRGWGSILVCLVPLYIFFLGVGVLYYLFLYGYSAYIYNVCNGERTKTKFLNLFPILLIYVNKICSIQFMFPLQAPTPSPRFQYLPVRCAVTDLVVLLPVTCFRDTCN